MLHHEESPEKPQYNMATPPFLDKHPPPPPFCLTPPFLEKIFRPPPFPSILKKSNPPPPFIKGGVRTMQVLILSPNLSNPNSSTHPNAKFLKKIFYILVTSEKFKYQAHE